MALLSVLCTLQHSALGHAAAAAHHRAATHTRLGCQIAAPAGAGGIAHAITHERWSASVASTVAALLDLDEARAAWLCEFGAVYVGGERAIDPAALIGASAHLRVHTTPRLYPAADSTDWLGSIVHDSANFVILDKPRGVPTHAAVDNAIQTCQARLSAALGVPLGCPHRLDVQTRGLLVLSKSAKFLEGFNCLLRDRRGVRKGYRALCEPSLGDDTPIPPLGELRHWIRPGKFEPTRLVPQSGLATPLDSAGPHPPLPGWRECACVLRSAREVRVTFDDDDGGGEGRGAGHGGGGGRNDGRRLTEFALELRTGRTHQLRAQLAYVGWPICGDDVYGGAGKGAAEARDVAAVAAAAASARSEHVARSVSEEAHDSAGEVQVAQASNGVIQRIAIPAKVSDGFLGLVASELEFDCPLGSQERYSYALTNDRLWR